MLVHNLSQGDRSDSQSDREAAIADFQRKERLRAAGDTSLSGPTLGQREELVGRAFTAGLYRLRCWQLGLSDELATVSDKELLAEATLPGVWVSIASVPRDLPVDVAASSGWWYELKRLGTARDSVLWAEISAPAVEIAAASLRTTDPSALVCYALTFWAHLACHNFLQGITEPHDTCDVSRYEADGVADHLARVIGLQAYGYPVGLEPLDPADPGVSKVMTGRAIPMFEERARRLGRLETEHAGRTARRAWRRLGERVIYAGLPAAGASVVPGADVAHVAIGGLVRAYRGMTLDDVPVHASAAYAEHLARGTLDSERQRLEASLQAIRAPE